METSTFPAGNAGTHGGSACNSLLTPAARAGLPEIDMEDVVIVAAGRTAIGKFGGTLAKIPATELGAQVVKQLLAKTGIDPASVSEVIMGQVLTAGVGQHPARQTVI